MMTFSFLLVVSCGFVKYVMMIARVDVVLIITLTNKQTSRVEVERRLLVSTLSPCNQSSLRIQECDDRPSHPLNHSVFHKIRKGLALEYPPHRYGRSAERLIIVIPMQSLFRHICDSHEVDGSFYYLLYYADWI